MLRINTIHHGDCLEVMNQIDDKSIDMILCDLPYGTTACKWDSIIPFEPLWKHYKRIIKDNGAIVLFGSQPFTSLLVCSNLKMFKYEWVWLKSVGGSFLSCNKIPLKRHENICVFYNNQCIYNPQMGIGKPYTARRTSGGIWMGEKNAKKVAGWITKNNGERYPLSYINFANETGLHPTQKPVVLCEYLIKTYTNENDLILDNCAGSGTTGIACRNLNRNFILIEKELEYVELIKERLSEPYQKQLFV